MQYRSQAADDDDDDEDICHGCSLPVVSKPRQRPRDLPPPVVDELRQLDGEIQGIAEQIRSLQELKASLERSKRDLIQKFTSGTASSSVSTYPTSANGNASNGPPQGGYAAARKSNGTTDYTQSSFPWSGELLNRAKKTWGIKNWRMCQEGVVNAVLDSRDVVCIMPTGGGKSLCYQLPAIMSRGVTLVVSPLISLAMDQCFHLQEAGVPCEFMSAAAPKEQANDILKRVRHTGEQDPENEIRILFVTPERVAKSQSLKAALTRAYEKGRLARIVIDEAHCCSNQGHDFRPDYTKLSILRKLYPNTKTTCLTATCSPTVLKDVLNILGMPSTTDPTAAWSNRTVYFTAPLYRPNLIYKVIPRPSGAQAAMQSICEWILQYHSNETGIIYCLSKKETETTAQQLNELSQGKIKTGCYHADVDDHQKHSIHVKWREGKIRVVCATIAFGMGIDKPDVRFVLHAGISKSFEGYLQESGRAGRDGQDADCILFYRPQDASRMASLVSGEPAGRAKLGAMLEYAQSSRCRKLLFGEYFDDAFKNNDPCGKCDNCMEPTEPSDVSFQAWKIVMAVEEIYDEGGRVTVASLADAVRGLKSGSYSIAANNKGRGRRFRGANFSNGPRKAGLLNMDEYGGKISDLSGDDVERVIVSLLNQQYLKEEYQATAYSVNVYVGPGPMGVRLSRQSLEGASRLAGVLKVTLSSKGNKKKKAAAPAVAAKDRGRSSTTGGNGAAALDGSDEATKKGKAKKRQSNGSSSAPPAKRGRGSKSTRSNGDMDNTFADDSIDSEAEESAWLARQRQAETNRRREEDAAGALSAKEYQAVMKRHRDEDEAASRSMGRHPTISKRPRHRDEEADEDGSDDDGEDDDQADYGDASDMEDFIADDDEEEEEAWRQSHGDYGHSDGDENLEDIGTPPPAPAQRGNKPTSSKVSSFFGPQRSLSNGVGRVQVDKDGWQVIPIGLRADTSAGAPLPLPERNGSRREEAIEID